MIKLAFDEANKLNDKIPQMPLAECSAMSQGYIGYHLQQGIKRQLRKENMPWHVATVVTRVEVDKNDPAFSSPSKPIGSYYTKDEAERFMKENNNTVYGEDAGRGYRKLVASPKPKDIVEKDSILNLLDNEFVVISCGGGGIPVIKTGDGEYEGVEAVIDKDFAAAALAKAVNAKYLFILTAVERVCLNFNSDNQTEIDEMTVDEAEKYIKENQFAKGSMLPKVQAAIEFAKGGKDKRAVIASLEKAPLVLSGESGTLIHL